MAGTRHWSLLPALLAAGVLGVLLPLLLAACERPVEDEYVDASSKLTWAEETLARREKALAASEKAAESAKKRLERDRKALIRAREDLARAEGRLGQLATDEVLFRTIQRRLLDDKRLRATAISVRVAQGVVTLTGHVASEEMRQRAAATVSGARGVKAIDNRIELAPASPRG